MLSSTIPVHAGRVTTEGDDLYYEVRGKGTPILMIPGGGGDSRWFALVADILANEYKVITYDRRGGFRSTTNHPNHFDMHQHSRDGVAVLQAAGEHSAYVVGNSSGAVIALDMAVTQPQAVRAVIAHEPPLTKLHPNAKKWQKFFSDVHGMAGKWGASLAMLRFVFGVRLPILAMIKAARHPEMRQVSSREERLKSTNYFVYQEILPVTNYDLHIERIKENGIRVFPAVGKGSLDKKRFYAETVPVLAERFGEEMVAFPGHHMSFWDMPEEWANILRKTLRRAEEVSH
jgi:pimeloyl-ACP methyl ester carboxylesterase